MNSHLTAPNTADSAIVSKYRLHFEHIEQHVAAHTWFPVLTRQYVQYSNYTLFAYSFVTRIGITGIRRVVNTPHGVSLPKYLK